jgi:hypothetical protein
MAQTVPVDEKAKVGAKVWIGRGLSGLVVAFMLFDGIGKVAVEQHVVQAMAELGCPCCRTTASDRCASTRSSRTRSRRASAR